MPTLLTAGLFVLLIAGLVLAFFAGRRKGRERFNASIADAKAEAVAALQADLSNSVNVQVDASQHHRLGEESRPVSMVWRDHVALDYSAVADSNEDARWAAALQRAIEHNDFDDLPVAGRGSSRAELAHPTGHRDAVGRRAHALRVPVDPQAVGREVDDEVGS